jgi:hypothetical protein
MLQGEPRQRVKGTPPQKARQVWWQRSAVPTTGNFYGSEDSSLRLAKKTDCTWKKAKTEKVLAEWFTQQVRGPEPNPTNKTNDKSCTLRTLFIILSKYEDIYLPICTYSIFKIHVHIPIYTGFALYLNYILMYMQIFHTYKNTCTLNVSNNKKRRIHSCVHSELEIFCT